MNFENQGVIKRLADQYGPENLAVVLGNGEASGVEVFAETVTAGDPSYAGPLAGVSLKIPVYHVLEEEVMAVVPEAEWTLFSHRLIFHGRRVCKSRKPDCERCTLKSFCPKIGVKPS